MNRLYFIILTVSGLFLSGGIAAQVGIGTITPDTSAVLDLYSTTKGLLIPRMTSVQRDGIIGPAAGLMIYNQTSNDVEMNSGTTVLPVWTGMKGSAAGSSITSITASDEISTSSTTSVLITGLTISPPAGTYLVMFNGQYGLTAGEAVSTAQGVIDLQAAYDQIMAITATNTMHGPIFGNGEILSPGIYDLPAAASLAATLTLDGGGDTNSVFIIRVVGALTTGALTTVVLTNGARSNNIFWVSEAAIALAANTIMKGTIIAHAGAVSGAAGTNLEGRMFSLTGAIAFGPGTITLPPGNSYIDLGVLSTFILFTSVGALANTNPSNLTGDVGTNAGAIAGFGSLNGNIYYPGSPPPINNSLATFSIYQNGTLVASSSRTSDINTSEMALQAMATVDTGEAIDIRWKVDQGGVELGNRILTIVKAN